MLVIWDYRCNGCENEEEIIVDSKEQDCQKCKRCDTPLTRVMAATPGWVDFPGRTEQQLKLRSEVHTERMLHNQNDLALNERQTQTSREWRNKTRSKNTKKGVVEENSNKWKGWADTPAIETVSQK